MLVYTIRTFYIGSFKKIARITNSGFMDSKCPKRVIYKPNLKFLENLLVLKFNLQFIP